MAKAKETNTPIKISRETLRISQGNLTFHLLVLPAKVLVEVSYVAARGDTDETGAVQRILNSKRIGSIREYALKVRSFPNSIILNWVSTAHDLVQDGAKLNIPIEKRCAQIIDGQHRVAGIREAISEDPSIGDLEIPVALYRHLGTRECADIFLSINTEQKPVPKSLVYDLYGLASEYIVDYAANRAKDIATVLDEQLDSPYQGFIKFPGPVRTRGGIALSTVVAAIKPLVAEKGVFEQAGIESLDSQSKVFINFFSALKMMYGDLWDDRDNAFIYAAGFSGAVDFLKSRLFDYCVHKRTFTSEAIRKVLLLDKKDLILQTELKGLGGAKARQKVAERLVDAFNPGDEVSSFAF
jgi:DNA sulfur modification protein DndB